MRSRGRGAWHFSQRISVIGILPGGAASTPWRRSRRTGRRRSPQGVVDRAGVATRETGPAIRTNGRLLEPQVGEGLTTPLCRQTTERGQTGPLGRLLLESQTPEVATVSAHALHPADSALIPQG